MEHGMPTKNESQLITMAESKAKKIAIIDHNKCKPNTPVFDYLRAKSKICKHNCIYVEGKKIIISENACAICYNIAKRAPGDAVKVVNLPSNSLTVTHSYGPNSFKLHGLPSPQAGVVLGLLGTNGIGKSTAISILSGTSFPNFGKSKEYLPTEKQVFNYFRGSALQKYFKALKQGLRVVHKHQDMQYYVIRDPEFSHLSGGEQQLRICKQVAASEADVYIFDEPTNYLDVKQRLIIADLIQGLKADASKYVIVTDHDLSFLDYCSDVISVMYGVSGAYGVASTPYTAPEAINHYLDGYLPTENMRFRSEPFVYCRNLENLDVELLKSATDFSYPNINIEHPGFSLHTVAGIVPSHSSVTIILGENGTGKTSFLKAIQERLGLSMSVKSQYPKFSNVKDDCSVRTLLATYASKAILDQMFRSDVVKPLSIDCLMDKQLRTLSGGEQQRVAVVCCLAQEKDLYILDEPSAMLDIEQRVNLCKVIKRYIYHNRKAAFIVEHDISVALSIGKELNSHVIVFNKDKKDGVSHSTASLPMNMQQGMNEFLKILSVTFRRNEKYKRHRINKPGSTKDIEQRRTGRYFVD
jgi:ATP-binding cassette subfamily E protein 1